MIDFSEYIRNMVEITVLAVMFFYILRVLRRTRGLLMLGTVTFLLAILWVSSDLLEMTVLRWIVQQTSYYLPFFIIVIFQTEIRRLLTMVQVTSLRKHVRRGSGPKVGEHELTTLLYPAVSRMSSAHVGALIAIEQRVGLEAWAVSGARLDAPLRGNQLLETIFHEGGPLHDGGVIIRKNEILAASCTFPLSERDDGNVVYGMRHQAAIGLSEQCDAVIVVVSEETGRISVANNGVLKKMANVEEFRDTLNRLLLPVKRSDESGGLRRPFNCLGQYLWRQVRRARVAIKAHMGRGQGGKA